MAVILTCNSNLPRFAIEAPVNSSTFKQMDKYTSVVSCFALQIFGYGDWIFLSLSFWKNCSCTFWNIVSCDFRLFQVYWFEVKVVSAGLFVFHYCIFFFFLLAILEIFLEIFLSFYIWKRWLDSDMNYLWLLRDNSEYRNYRIFVI